MIADGRRVVSAVICDGPHAATKESFAGKARHGSDVRVEWADLFAFDGELIRQRYTRFVVVGV